MDKLLALGRAQAPTCPALRRQAHNSTPRAHVRHRSTISSSRRTWVSRHRVQAMERGGERPATALGPPSPATIVVEEGPKSSAAASISTLINVSGRLLRHLAGRSLRFCLSCTAVLRCPSAFSTRLFTLQVAVGAGVLSMPFATEKVGLGLGVALTGAAAAAHCPAATTLNLQSQAVLAFFSTGAVSAEESCSWAAVSCTLAGRHPQPCPLCLQTAVLVASVEAYTLCVLTQFAEQTGATSYSSLVRGGLWAAVHAVQCLQPTCI